MTRLIGLGGLLRAGKDATADYLREEHGFLVMGMSEPLLEAALALNPWVQLPGSASLGRQMRFTTLAKLVEEVGYTEAKKNPEVRRFLQVLGTEVGRQMIGENVWVDIAGRRIDEARDQGYSVALTGVRFPNEFDMIRSRRGTLVWIDRPGIIRPVELHASENSVTGDDFDVTIVNDGSLDDLYAKADALAA